jgi:hypothetical protein
MLVQFPQSQARMTVASEGLHAAIVDGRLRHPGDPELDRQVAAAVARRTRRGWRLGQGRAQRAGRHCDRLAMAVEGAQHRAEPVRLLGWI